MSEQAEDRDRGASLNWKAILGIADPAVAPWPRVRDAQLAELARLFPLICVSTLAHGLALVGILWGAVPAWQLLAWLGALIVTIASGARAAEPQAPRTIRQACLLAAGVGLAWAVPPIFFSDASSLEQQLALCLICAASIASAALAVATVPSAMLTYMMISGTGLSIMMMREGSPTLMLVPPAFILSVAMGGLSVGQAFVRRKFAELQLEEKNEVVSLLLREFEQGSADWLWQIDAAKRLHHVSPGLARAAGTTTAALEGKPLLALLAGDPGNESSYSSELNSFVELLNNRQSFSDLHLAIPVGGETRWWCLSAAPRMDDRARFMGFRGVGSDVTEQRRSAEAIDRLARFDALTGLANRQHLTDALRKALTRAHRAGGRCGLLLIDLDRFKPVNDTLGHPVGDQLLKQVADRLRSAVRPTDLCGRLGGDEFAILVRDLDHVDRIAQLGDRIVAELGRPFEVDGNIISIGASAGAAIGPKDGRSLESLMRSADLALYRAKEDGRGVARRYEPSMLQRAERRRATENALREAIDEGQFQLVFQPIIEVARGEIQSFEALLRWHHPKLGEIPPSEFLPIADEARLTARIGEWVLRTACQEAAQWPETIRVAVNLTSAQLQDPQLPTLILSALSHSGLSAHRLELEISEAIFLRDRVTVLPILDRLRTLGVRISLDDFGTGYASLGYLTRDRFSSIKIDRRFVTGVADNELECLAIVRGIVAMAGSLGITTTGEGTETLAQQERLVELGCTYVQGHQIAAPLSAELARELVADTARRMAS